MTRRAWVAAAVAVPAAVSVGAVVVLSGSTQASPGTGVRPANTAKVVRGTLADMVSADGTLTYRARPDGSPYVVINRASGTYTKLPGEGAKVGCGDVLYRVDNDPVLLLCGAVPAYRGLRVGDAGKDVRQLNRTLHRLGYHADPRDRAFTGATERALARLQRRRGLHATGALAARDALFLPAPVRIAKVTGALGGSARPGAPVLQATSDTPEVQVDLDASQQGVVKRGDRAQVTLPGNRPAAGRVQRLGRVARTAGKNAADATIPAFIGLNDPRKARDLDRAPVQVDITTRGIASALSVPVTAIVGRSGGGYAVEVVRPGGRRELVAVRLGLFDTAGGRVQVAGALRAGDRVVVPSL
jgi:peptidoglycan hydrolase-like protein with peptidoglycan-binding domain